MPGTALARKARRRGRSTGPGQRCLNPQADQLQLLIYVTLSSSGTEEGKTLGVLNQPDCSKLLILFRNAKLFRVILRSRWRGHVVQIGSVQYTPSQQASSMHLRRVSAR